MSFAVLCDHCSSWGSLWQKAEVPLVFSCTDWRTTRRGTKYDGDPARGTSRFLWEAVVPHWGLVGGVSWVACKRAGKLLGLHGRGAKGLVPKLLAVG